MRRTHAAALLLSAIAATSLVGGLVGFVASCTTQPAASDAAPEAEISDGEVLTETGACGPGDGGIESGRMNPPRAPGATTPPYAGRCSGAQIDDYAHCQTDQASLCGEFLAGQPGADCAACIETQSTAPVWGVLVFTGSQQARFNYGGCVDLALGQVDAEPNSCGQLLYASYACQETACVLCEGQTSGGVDAFSACAALAISSGGVCAPYDALVQDPSGPCGPAQDAGPDVQTALAHCFPETTDVDAGTRQNFLRNIVGYFCGDGGDGG